MHTNMLSEVPRRLSAAMPTSMASPRNVVFADSVPVVSCAEYYDTLRGLSLNFQELIFTRALYRRQSRTISSSSWTFGNLRAGHSIRGSRVTGSMRTHSGATCSPKASIKTRTSVVHDPKQFQGVTHVWNCPYWMRNPVIAFSTHLSPQKPSTVTSRSRNGNSHKHDYSCLMKSNEAPTAENLQPTESASPTSPQVETVSHHDSSEPKLGSHAAGTRVISAELKASTAEDQANQHGVAQSTSDAEHHTGAEVLEESTNTETLASIVAELVETYLIDCRYLEDRLVDYQDFYAIYDLGLTEKPRYGRIPIHADRMLEEAVTVARRALDLGDVRAAAEHILLAGTIRDHIHWQYGWLWPADRFSSSGDEPQATDD